MPWQTNGTPDTLVSSGDDIDITDLTPLKFNQFLLHTLGTGAANRQNITFENNSNTVYASRWSINGGADVTATGDLFLNTSVSAVLDNLTVMYVISISSEEKLVISNNLGFDTAGAGAAPFRKELVGKFVPSPDTDITRIDSNNIDVGSYDTNSNLSALGTD